MTDWLKATLQVLICSSVTSFSKFKCRIFGLFFLSFNAQNLSDPREDLHVSSSPGVNTLHPSWSRICTEQWRVWFWTSSHEFASPKYSEHQPRTQMTQIMKSFGGNSFSSLSNKLGRKMLSTKEQSRGFSGNRPSTKKLVAWEKTLFPIAVSGSTHGICKER